MRRDLKTKVLIRILSQMYEAILRFSGESIAADRETKRRNITPIQVAKIAHSAAIVSDEPLSLLMKLNRNHMHMVTRKTRV